MHFKVFYRILWRLFLGCVTPYLEYVVQKHEERLLLFAGGGGMRLPLALMLRAAKACAGAPVKEHSKDTLLS